MVGHRCVLSAQKKSGPWDQIFLVHIVVLSIALVVFKVGKRSCLNTDVEGPTLVVAERNPHKRHLPAVQVSRDGYRCHRHLAGREVVTRRGGNHHLGR